ncbi:MAG: YeaH/YhbH family protein [Acetobacter sp.]|nr:YeaH/YhbH family protein [Acetobacter sp.]MCH4061061.1 YeaH/YhbH family protein [Acetobacter sp.]MCH4088000.1 YeaH/YhbH family protein [Acetobacter sp.]MCI1293387.1 YeaH/YhbH family protein [Acetobacter sp.]MCI1319988.1 YeaH/YhbH family protein [Acetobacter sp.]
MDIIDRRSNPHGKNMENRRRALERARSAVQQAVRDAVSQGKIRQVGEGNSVSIPADALHEPTFHVVFTSGIRHLVLSGNKEFVKGDRLRHPPSGGGKGDSGQGEAGDEGGGEDSYRFLLNRDEFLDLFFGDLELPDLVKREILTTDSTAPSRAGLSSDGSPSQLDLARTMRYSMARRIGLGRPKSAELLEVEARIQELESKDSLTDVALDELSGLQEQRIRLRQRMTRIPWVDPVDLRFRRYAQVPKPSTRAVMFCVMDVSGSMTERMKDLAKQFFLLLHIFLEKRYTRVDLVFIRHAESAEEVDEETFFNDPRTGGTVVSSALEEVIKVQKARYPAQQWNIYVAQASDGDNSLSDTSRTADLLENGILPVVQYYAYIEVAGSGAIIRGETDLWRSYGTVASRCPRLAMRRVSDRREIFPVFRDLFSPRENVGGGVMS